MSEPGMEAVMVTLAGAVKPDASGGVGDPLAKVEPYLAILRAVDAIDKAAGRITLDLTDPALPDRLGDWKFRSEHLGFTADYCTRYLAAHPEDRARYRLWGVAVLEFLAELGRAG